MIRKSLIKWVARHPGIYPFLTALGIKKDYEVGAFLKHIHRGDTVYDIGANVGRFSRLFSLIVGPAGSVYAFEPVQKNYRKVLDLSRKFGNILPHQLVVKDQKGSETIYIPDNDSAQSSIVRQSWGNWETAGRIDAENCTAVSIDAFISETRAKTPHFVKIDAEGSELLILKGARRLLQAHHPKLFMELNALALSKFDITPREILQYLMSLSYDYFELVTLDGTYTVDPERFESLFERHFSPNLFCVKK